jgi:pyruvate dehydrogenase E2 component (dihydrolipoamide acetyltransferase)
MPRLGQSVESCILVSWQVKKGDAVILGQRLGSIETDKSSFDIEAPTAGVVLELFFDEGADIPVLTHIAAIGNAGEDISALRPGGTIAKSGSAARAAVPGSIVAPVGAQDSPTISDAEKTGAVSPRAKSLAAKHGIDVSRLAGSGPGGRVIERDVQAAATGGPRVSMAARAAGATPGSIGGGLGGMFLSNDKIGATAAPDIAGLGPTPSDQVVAVKGIRKLIADRMKASLASTAQLTMTMSFDASAIQSYRARAKQSHDAVGGPKVTINDLICYALGRVLPRHRDLNAHFLGDKVVKHSAVHLGIAVDTPRGLMVPVLRDAHTLTIRELGSSIRALADQCQKGSISPDHLSGGTFTITNLGVSGVETFTPVLNVPEVAILGVGGIQLRPVKRGNGVEFVEAISLCLTVDHQVVDGAPAARFLKELCATLERSDLLPDA